MRKFTLVIVTLLLGFAGHAQYAWMDIYSTSDGSALNCVDFIDLDHGVAVGNGGTVIITADGGENWETLETGYNNDFEGVNYYAEEIIVITGNSGTLLRTTDGGNMWASIDHPGGQANLYDIDIDTATGKGLIAGSGNLIIWTEDAGATWTYVDGGYMNNYNSAFMANSDFGIVAGRNAIFQPLLGFTENGGDSWDYLPVYPVIGGTANEGTAYDTYFFNTNDGFLVGSTWSGGGFITTEVNWESTNWEAIELDQPLFAIDFANDNLGVVAGWQGYMAETTNGGATWDDVSMSLSREPGTFNDAKMYESTGYAVTENGVVFKRVSTTNVENDPNPEKDFIVYPNPVEKGFTNLHLNLNESSDVSISVRDVTGREVMQKQLVELNTGNQQFQLNTTGLKAGVYLVVVNAGEYRMTQKLVVR